VIDARRILATALALAATTAALPAAAAVADRAPAPRHSLTPAVDIRHQALIARHGAGERRRSETRQPSSRAAAAPASVRVVSGGPDWGDAALELGSLLGIALVAGGAAIGIGHRRTRMGHPVN
jgi:hypothetical protein